jgi:hypothetical protein
LAFPVYSNEDLGNLIDDIRAHGMRQPLTLFEGKILDGRNRAEAAKRTGLLFIPIEEFEGTFEQARDYVISLNLIRRHLDTGQRAMIAAQLAKLSHGGDRSKPQNCGLPAKDAAKQLKVSTRSVETAKAVRKADPALAEEVKQGKTKLSTAAKKTAALKAIIEAIKTQLGFRPKAALQQKPIYSGMIADDRIEERANCRPSS